MPSQNHEYSFNKKSFNQSKIKFFVREDMFRVDLYYNTAVVARPENARSMHPGLRRVDQYLRDHEVSLLSGHMQISETIITGYGRTGSLR